MAQAGFSFFAIILAALTGFIQNPPEDLLSLAETKTVLAELKIEQSEESLISLISGNSAPKSDTSGLDKAVKLLREGNFKERKSAKKVLNAAGEEYKAYFQKLAKDSDPEVSETAKAVLKNFSAKTAAAKKMGMTDDVLKILAIRRLTELKSTRALDAIQVLKSSENKDIAMEAERASAILQGKKPKRHSRNEGTQKLLKMLPRQTGFVAALDLTEPTKDSKLSDYLGAMKKIPGMELGMVTGMFNKSLPNILQKVGNPQIDAVVFVSSAELGVDNESSWVGFIGIGRYNSEKIKAFLKEENMKPAKAHGIEYWSDRWGPSICPLNDEIFFLSFGDNNSNHMSKLLANVKSETIPESAKNISTYKNRLVASGKLSKKQKEILKKEVKQELARMEGRNRQGIEAEKAMMELALLCASSESFTGKYEDKVISIKAEMENEESAKKMVSSITSADTEIRATLKQIPFPIFQAFNMEKRFSKSEISGKTVTLKIKGEMLDMMSMMPMMMFSKMQAIDRPMHAPEIQVDFEEAEAIEIVE